MTDASRSHRSRRKRSRRRKSFNSDDAPLEIRVGNRRASGYYVQLQATSGADAGRFDRMVDDTIRSNPRDPITIAINGYQPWLEDVLRSCIDDRWSELPDLNRELQFADTVKFPERSNKRSKIVPWSFIVDEMNLPEVYYWTFGQSPPGSDYTSDVDNYRFRIAVWTCGRGAYRFDERFPVTIIFTQAKDTSESVVRELLFTNLYIDEEYDVARKHEEWVCWIFLKLYWLLTDWQNIVREIERELEEAEINSRGRKTPVKLRTRAMHKQVDRLYELKEYLRFHSRSFKKLIKLKPSDKKPYEDDSDPVWEEMDNAVEDLDQFDYYMDSLKERFNNLIELEFNIESASQSDYSQFLSVIAALYLPISFLASIFGITTLTTPAIVYLYIAVPLLVLSIVVTMALPWAIRRFQKFYYPYDKKHLYLTRQSFTMLGDELPDSADVPRNVDESARSRGSRQQQARGRRSRSRSRSRSRMRVRMSSDRSQHREGEKL